MTLYESRKAFFEHNGYEFVYWKNYHYNKLANIMYHNTRGRRKNLSYNDCFIMADTETSKTYLEDDSFSTDALIEDIISFIKCQKLKHQSHYKNVASFRELRRVGLNLSYKHTYTIDQFYHELRLSYPYMFDELYNEEDELYAIYDFLVTHQPKEVDVNENYVVAWTISIRSFDMNICTLWGHKPSSFVECLVKIHNALPGCQTFVYFHNLTYDYTFLRKFLFEELGYPTKQLNTKPRYPIYIAFGNGIILKDSLILAQRSLEKWSNDLDVEHKKSIGKWDYDLIRTQDEKFSAEELEYIEHDTLAGVECLNKLAHQLNKTIASMPFTATGIPREETRKRGFEAHFKDTFLKMHLNYSQYIKMTKVFHGGYTHGNRHLCGITIRDVVKCFDFASSYPFCLIAYKFPMEKFIPSKSCSIEHILNNADKRAYIFKLVMVRPHLKSDDIPMPALQFSKCVKSINSICDNGRVLCADYVEIYLNEIDLNVISKQYAYDKAFCVEVETALKAYLPKWFTNYVYECFMDKTTLKGGDPVLYQLAKAKLNSLYGMCVTRCIRDNYIEDFDTYEYSIEDVNPIESYDKYVKNRNNILPYQWGVWVTSYAQDNLFTLGESFDTWLYSDTDSCYGIGVNQEKIDAFNNECIKLIKDAGFGGVDYNGKTYHLGVAEHIPEEDTYIEFKYLGAKRYCGRRASDLKLKITVAGVPKKNGVKCLNNDIDEFKVGKIFDGFTTGKKLHTYITVPHIHCKNGIEYGDSINLTPCDYNLSSIKIFDWQALFDENTEVVEYDTEKLLL